MFLVLVMDAEDALECDGHLALIVKWLRKRRGSQKRAEANNSEERDAFHGISFL